MAKNITFENKDFSIIPDDDKEHIIYVLVDFRSGNYKEFYIRETGIFYFLYVSTVKMPNGFWAYGFESNILELSNQKVHGTAMDGFNTELEALRDCLNKFIKYGVTAYKYGLPILEQFDKYVNPKTLFE